MRRASPNNSQKDFPGSKSVAFDPFLRTAKRATHQHNPHAWRKCCGLRSDCPKSCPQTRKKAKRPPKKPLTWFNLESGGVVLPHKTVCLEALSRFHMEISLFPCTLDISHECSVGCGITFLILTAWPPKHHCSN